MPRYLVIGSGAREHALAWKLAQESDAEVLVTPGNPGVAQTPGCRVVDVAVDDQAALARLARSERVDLTVVGPEAPLCVGLADHFRSEGLPIFGPGAAGARLEGSKAFAKEVMGAAGVPTADHRHFDDFEAAAAFVSDEPHPIVIKADGLAGGKGVFISSEPSESVPLLREFMEDARFGDASRSVVIEDFLEGPEMSFMVVTDGQEIVPLSTSRDHKRLLEGDEGENTGGMGAVTPSPDASDDLCREIVKTIVAPTLAELRSRDITYRGFLYVGLMLTDSGPKVLEFNVRLGDPETQALLFAMEKELGPVLSETARGELSEQSLETDRAACCVVLASKGYPFDTQTGDRIDGLDSPTPDHTYVFHAGTERRDGAWYTAGGRVLGVTARGPSAEIGRERAYAAAEEIEWAGMQFRRDIGV